MKTHKKIFSVILASLLTFVFALSCFAQDNERVLKTYTEDLGNGITAVVTITESSGLTRGSKTHTLSKEYYSSGTYIGNAALMASFYYDGSTSRATGAGGAGSGANGWSYGGQSTGTSGNRAYLNATLSNGSRSVPVSLSPTCSPSGSIS